MDLGSGDGTVELGRTKVRKLRLDVDSGTLSCRATGVLAEPSEAFTCEVGSGDVEVVRLGDFKPRDVEVKVGSGSARVDLEGAWVPGEISVRLDVGSGSLDVRIPGEVGFSVTGRTGSGDVHVGDRRYHSQNFEHSEHFDTARVRLRIIADVGWGQLRLHTVPQDQTEV